MYNIYEPSTVKKFLFISAIVEQQTVHRAK